MPPQGFASSGHHLHESIATPEAHMFRKLLVPLDGSSLAEQAIGRAAAIARETGAELELVLVHHPFPSDAFEDAPWNEEEWSLERDYLDGIADELSAGASIPVARRILKGSPAEAISERARELPADLIVMTSHGRTGFNRAWLGSVADAVIRDAASPVLLLRPVEDAFDALASRKRFSRIVVPLDGSPRSAEVLPTVRALAAASEARVWLLRIVRPAVRPSTETRIPFMYAPPIVDDAATQKVVGEANEYLAWIAQQFSDESGVAVETAIVVADNVAQAILDFAKGHEADLVGMSTHGRGASRLLVGSIADKVLRGSDVPLLAYRPIDIAARERARAEAASREGVLAHS